MIGGSYQYGENKAPNFSGPFLLEVCCAYKITAINTIIP